MPWLLRTEYKRLIDNLIKNLPDRGVEGLAVATSLSGLLSTTRELRPVKNIPENVTGVISAIDNLMNSQDDAVVPYLYINEIKAIFKRSLRAYCTKVNSLAGMGKVNTLFKPAVDADAVTALDLKQRQKAAAVALYGEPSHVSDTWQADCERRLEHIKSQIRLVVNIKPETLAELTNKLKLAGYPVDAMGGLTSDQILGLYAALPDRQASSVGESIMYSILQMPPHRQRLCLDNFAKIVELAEHQLFNVPDLLQANHSLFEALKDVSASKLQYLMKSTNFPPQALMELTGQEVKLLLLSDKVRVAQQYFNVSWDHLLQCSKRVPIVSPEQLEDIIKVLDEVKSADAYMSSDEMQRKIPPETIALLETVFQLPFEDILLIDDVSEVEPYQENPLLPALGKALDLLLKLSEYPDYMEKFQKHMGVDGLFSFLRTDPDRFALLTSNTIDNDFLKVLDAIDAGKITKAEIMKMPMSELYDYMLFQRKISSINDKQQWLAWQDYKALPEGIRDMVVIQSLFARIPASVLLTIPRELYRLHNENQLDLVRVYKCFGFTMPTSIINMEFNRDTLKYLMNSVLGQNLPFMSKIIPTDDLIKFDLDKIKKIEAALNKYIRNSGLPKTSPETVAAVKAKFIADLDAITDRKYNLGQPAPAHLSDLASADTPTPKPRRA